MVLAELIFDPNEAELDQQWPILGLEFVKRHFEQKIGKFCDCSLKWGFVELRNAEKG